MTKKVVTIEEAMKMIPGKTKIRITERINGHTLPIGSVHTFSVRNTTSGSGVTTIRVVGDPAQYWLYANEYEIIRSRADLAAYLETEIETMEKKITEMKIEAARLRKYKDDNDELAHLISETIKSDGSPESIYTLLTKFNISK